MKTKTSRWAGAAAALLIFSSAAMAQDGRSQITVEGTGVVIRNSEGQGISQNATKSGGLLVGYTYPFYRWGAVEAAYGYTRNTQRYSNSLGQTAIQSNISEITGAFVLQPPVESIVKPYALAGGGALVFDPTTHTPVANADQQTRGAFVYGGGVNFDITRSFGVRAEYRGFVYKTPDFTIGNLNPDKFTHLAQPSAGIFVRF